MVTNPQSSTKATKLEMSRIPSIGTSGVVNESVGSTSGSKKPGKSHFSAAATSLTAKPSTMKTDFSSLRSLNEENDINSLFKHK